MFNIGMWVDSKGQQLLITRSKSRVYPGGPPEGCNIILNLPSPIEWPPTNKQFIPQQQLPPPPPVLAEKGWCV